MRAIKLLLVFFVVLNTTAQTFSESLADPVVAIEKGFISGLLGAELGLRKDQRQLLKDLRKLEDEYADKRTPLSNTATAGIIAAIEFNFSNLRERIRNVEHNINVVKFASLGLYGLRRYKAQLQKEKEYLNKLEKENETLRSGLLFSGSAGDNYTVYLKLLLKQIPIKNNVMVIEKEIKARMTITRILAK